jgi:CubicO group peptidase (beta-lactamase class C family)
MRRFIRFFLFLLWLSSATCFGQTPANSDKKIDAAVRALIKKNKLIRIEIGILKNGRTTYYSYGETERGSGQLPNEHTLFEIGSITKTFTTTLLACTVNEGKLSLNDPNNKYLPDSIPPLEYQGTPITLLTMANHFSGLPRMPSNLNALSYANYDVNALYSFYMDYKLSRKPGAKFEYSNLAADMLKYAAANIGNAPSGLNEAILLTHQVTRRQKDQAIGLAWGIDLSEGNDCG